MAIQRSQNNTMLAPLVPTATDVFINNTGEAYEPKLGI
jgi:hypothetical protein